MKKTFLLSVLALAGTVFGLSAEVLSPYNEGFENSSFRPRGWTQATASSYAAGTYTVNADGGHTGGCIGAKQYSNYYSSYYNNYNYIDVIVTPKVTGTVSIWVKKNGSDPSLTFYSLTDPMAVSTSSPLLSGTTKNLVEGKTIDDWTQITVTGVPADTHIGIRANDLLLDDFSASSANVTYRASILADVKNTTGSTTLEAGPDNNVTVKFSVSLENNGDVEFPASAGGFKIQLSNRALDKVVGTGSIDDAIPFGATVTKDFSMTFPAELAPDTKSNSFYVTISNDKVGSVEASLAWFTIIEYKPVATFMYAEDNDKNQSSYNDVNIVETITVGAGAAGTSRTLWLWNSGTAPMKVTATNVTGDFTCNTGSFTLARNEKKAVNVALKGAAGKKTGKVTFKVDGIGDVSYDLLGLVTKSGDYSENFEAAAIPAGYIPGRYWTLTNSPETLAPLGGKQWIVSQYASSVDKFILPKLTFAEGELFSFMAAKTDNTSSKLTVYTSKDRVEWTPVATIDTRSEDSDLCFANGKPTGTGYGTYEFKLYSFPMKAGDQYIALEAGGARVDNINGGKRTPVSHDIYVSKVGIPDKAMVNTRYIVSMTAANILDTPETDYDIVLELAGEVKAHATATPAMTTNEAIDFDIRFTPHETGKFEAAIVFVSGNYRQTLNEFIIDVKPEKAEATYQVGDAKITTTDPFNTYYDGSQCQILYRANDLDLAEGMKIIGTTFYGYATDGCKKHIKVYAQNTEDDSYDFSNIKPAAASSMTLVYEGDYQFHTGGNNSAKVYEPMMEIEFSTPFEYTGKNIRLMYDIRDIEGEGDGKHVFFTVDNSAYNYWDDIFDNRVITNKKDFQEDLDDEPSWSGYRAGFPVTYFKVAKDVVVVRGKLTDDFDQPVGGAMVKFESDDLLYSAVSDAQGVYYINVGNLDHVFTLGVDSEEFSPVSLANVTLDPKKQTEFVHNFKLAYIDRTATLTGQVFNMTDEDDVPLEGIDVVLTQGDVKVTATTDENGAYKITVPKFTGEYTLEVTDGVNTVYTAPYTFKSKVDKLDINVEYSGVGEISAASGDVKVSVSGGIVTVTAAEGTTVALYSATGTYYGSKTVNGNAVTFGPLTPGIYIVAGKKVAVN